MVNRAEKVFGQLGCNDKIIGRIMAIIKLDQIKLQDIGPDHNNVTIITDAGHEIFVYLRAGHLTIDNSKTRGQTVTLTGDGWKLVRQDLGDGVLHLSELD